MAVPRKDIPRVNLQPPSVDFIDNRLDEYHPAFKTNSNVQYDPAVGHYAIMPPGALMLEPVSEQSMLPRQALPKAGQLKFWNTLLPEAMDRLRGKPILKLKPEYLIRDKTSWEDVHDQLQKAQELYEGNSKSSRGRIKNILRNITDNSGSIKQVTDVVKQIDYVSVPMAVMGILLDVSRLLSLFGRSPGSVSSNQFTGVQKVIYR